MYGFMTILTHRNQPFNRLSANIIPGVFCMVDLASATAAINTAPVIPLEHNVTLTFPFIGFQVVPVIIAAAFAPNFKQPMP